MRLRNSCGSESSTSSATLTNCSPFILHPLRSLRVTVAFVFIVIFFFAVAFLFVLFLVWLLPKESTASHLRRGLAGFLGLAFVPAELLLKARPRVGTPLAGTHGNF